MLDVIFQLLPSFSQKRVQHNAGSLDYPPLPLLAPSNFVEVRLSENLRKTSAELFGEITVCYTEQDLVIISMNVKITIASDHTDNVA